MSSGEKYAAAAYAVVLLTVLVWIAIMAAKFARLEREKAELQQLLWQKESPTPSGDG